MNINPMRVRDLARILIAWSAAICVIVISPAVHAAKGLPSPIVETADGPVLGTVTDTIGTFFGIPYAAPPVGGLRWMPPVAPAPWTTPLDATAFGSECPQGSSTDEDCLFLNVYVPTKALESRRHRYPVMIWVHGGGYVEGAGSQSDPTRLVTMGNLIVVTINYRLGALGFLAHPALSAESSYGGSGNYGIMDQQFAMRWVKENIAAFGGNPKNVTIFGESAGGHSMFSNLVSPTAAGLFHRAIIESGSYEPILPTLAQAEAHGQSFAGAVGCSDQTAACLRAVPVSTVVANQAMIGIQDLLGMVATPNIDNYILTQSIGTALSSGQFNRVPVVDGTNHDEVRVFIALAADLGAGPLTAAELPVLADFFFGSNAPAVLAEYPLSDYPSPDLVAATSFTDYLFSCNALSADQAMAKFTTTYAYEFADENAPNGSPPVSFPYGASHAFELQYLFGATPNPAFAPGQLELSDKMIDAWTNFATDGNPGEGWKPLNRSADGFFESLVPPKPIHEAVSAFSADHKCSFWLALPAD